MKHAKGKYLRLTEQDLRKIVQETVNREIKVLLEYYAVSRSDFQRDVKNQIGQIAENWCLIHYCSLNNNSQTDCLEHWKDELKAACKNAAITKIKGNDSVESRYKAIHKVFDDLELNSDVSIIDELIVDKFVKEQINTKNTCYQQTLNDFMKSCDDICIALATRKYREYVDNL